MLAKQTTRYLRIHFPNLDFRAFSSEVGERSLHCSPWHLLQAMGTRKCSSGFAALCTCRDGIQHHHWKPVWDYHGEHYSAGMDLEGLRFIPFPSVVIFYYWYSSLCPLALAQSVQSTNKEDGEWQGNHLRTIVSLIQVSVHRHWTTRPPVFSILALWQREHLYILAVPAARAEQFWCICPLRNRRTRQPTKTMQKRSQRRITLYLENLWLLPYLRFAIPLCC